MKNTITGIFPTCLFLLASLAAFGQNPSAPGLTVASPPQFEPPILPESNDYPLGADSQVHADVPHGTTFAFELKDSTVFPGTSHTITVYVPAAYTGNKPACVYVGLDGLGFDAPTVFDNLIAQHAMPVIIGIGVSPGTVASAAPPSDPRFDRSFEFDSLSDRFAAFLLKDVFPEVEAHTTADGRPILLSQDPNDRAIGGASTGGIGAFTVAWERPDSFRRVFTAIGTFVGMRGGEQYYVFVRKTEPKSIRIFMQDGVHDEWPGGPEMGDWWMSDKTMERALSFAGYDVRHVWGLGTHNDQQATAVFPTAMRWLWRDWPSPIVAKEPGNPALQAILKPDEGWKVALGGCSSAMHLAADLAGRVYFQSGRVKRVSEVPPRPGMSQCASSDGIAPLAWGPGGRLYMAGLHGTAGIQVFGSHGRSTVLAKSLRVVAFTVRPNQEIYAVTSHAGKGEIWLIHTDGRMLRVADGLNNPSDLAFSPDGLWLCVAQHNSRSAFSYRVKPDGSLDAGEPFYQLELPAAADDSGAAAVTMDRDGRAYVATRFGVQVFDHNGRVTAILPLPGNQPATALCFGGKGFATLFVSSGGKVYTRKMNVAGAPPWAASTKVPNWGAG